MTRTRIVIVKAHHSYWMAPVRAMVGMCSLVLVVCWLSAKWTAVALWWLARWTWSAVQALSARSSARELPVPEAEEPVVAPVASK
jgi:hypothetical protein